MASRKSGYIKVISKAQNESRQMEAMKKIEISDRDIFLNKQLGKNLHRETISTNEPDD